MKKILLFLLCFFLIGCRKDDTVQLEDWIGTYGYDGIILEFYSLDDEGIEFEVNFEDKNINGYAYFDEKSLNKALYEATEDGHTLKFTLKNDKIIVEESGGMTYLNRSISGEYKKE